MKLIMLLFGLVYLVAGFYAPDESLEKASLFIANQLWLAALFVALDRQ